MYVDVWGGVDHRMDRMMTPRNGKCSARGVCVCVCAKEWGSRCWGVRMLICGFLLLLLLLLPAGWGLSQPRVSGCLGKSWGGRGATVGAAWGALWCERGAPGRAAGE